MKHLIVFIVGLLGFSGYAQDVITTKKGEDIQAEVLEVNVKEVRYKKYDNPQSPVYTILKSDILLIRYENGTKDIFNEESQNKATAYKYRITSVEGENFVNGQRISGGDMKNLLYQDFEAKRLYKKSQGFRAGSIVCSVGSIICSTVGIIMALDNKPTTDRYGYTTYNYDYLIPLSGAVGLSIPALILGKQANKRKAQAVEVYNRNQDARVTVTPVFGGNTAGVVIRF
ncbi:MAG: hypothetical protein Q3983_09865 [Capnocytophaga sp.]|nr:hypothetical protein [Capnocytophaga sp.]